VNPEERLDRIDELRRQIDEGRARIAEREAAREADPVLMHDYLMSEQEATAAPERGPPVRETDPAGIIYRRYENNAATAAAVDQAATAEWNAWFSAGFTAHTEVERRVTGEAIGEVAHLVKQELLRELAKRDREIANLKGENVEVKALLATTLKELADIRARTTAEHERVSELKADVKTELQILGHTDNELMQRFTALAQHL
jgi:hypothetical protein